MRIRVSMRAACAMTRTVKLSIIGTGVLAVLGAVMPTTARATLLAYEGFGQASGSSISGATPSGSGISSEGTISGTATGILNAASLSYTSGGNTLVTSGGSVNYGASSGGDTQLFTFSSAIANTSVTWVSFLYQSTNNAYANRAGFDYNGTTPDFGSVGERYYSGTNTGANPEFGFLTGAPGSPGINGSAVSSNGSTTHLIVARLSPSGNRMDMFVDPSLGGVDPLTSTAYATLGGQPNVNISSLRLVFRNSGGADFTIDELRVGDSFASVTPIAAVPEPASLGLLAIGSLSLLKRRRA